MGKQNAIQTSWTKGEISPLARGRVDVNLYANGAETIENLIVRPQGPLFRRSGTKFVQATRVPTNESVLIPFEVSDEQAYQLEFGKGYIRFFKDKEPIFDQVGYAVDNFTATNNGGLAQLSAESINTSPASPGDDFGDMPTFDVSCISPYDSGSNNIYQVSTSIPHTLRTGAKVFLLATGLSNLSGSITTIASNGAGSPKYRITLTSSDTIFPTTGTLVLYGCTGIDVVLNGVWEATRISGNTYDLLTGPDYIGTSGASGSWGRQATITLTTPRSFTVSVNTIIGTSASGFVATTGLVAGDKFLVGTSNDAALSTRHHITKSVEYAHQWTVANIDDNAGSPTGSIYVIPVEIETNYGYGKKHTAITAAASAGVGSRVLITCNEPHGLAVGDSVIIQDAGRGIDGQWTVYSSGLTSTEFQLSESVWYATSTSSGTGTVKKILTVSEVSFKDLKFAQSADVIYITHPLYPPMKLVRTDVDGDRNDWLFAEVAFNDGPYLPFNDLSPTLNETTPADGTVYPNVYFEISSYAHTATVKASAAFTATDTTPADGFSDDSGKYIEWKEGDQWMLGLLANTAPSATTATVAVVDNIMSFLDETTTLKSNYRPGSDVSTGVVYKAAGANGKFSKAGYYSNNGAVYWGKVDPNNELSSSNAKGVGVGSPTHGVGAGTITSQYSNTFASADVGKYVRIKDDSRTARAHWVQITALQNGSGGTSNKSSHSASVAMASNNATGKFVVASRSRTATITAKKDGAAFAAFAATDIGRSIRLGWAGRWAWGKITAYTSTSVVTVTLYTSLPRDTTDASKIAGNQDSIDPATGSLSNNPTTGITYDWRLGAWSDTAGFPAHVVFHEQRLAFAATTTEPQTFWMSVSADFENFMPTELDSTVLDDNAITYTLASAKANPIRWLVSGSSLGVGTSGGEWRVYAASGQNDPITPSSITAKENTTHGSLSRVAPAKTGSSIMFVDRSTWKVQELFYSYELDSMDSDELTVIGEHILREHGGAVCAAFQQKPHSIYWIVCADGTLSAMTFNKKQEVVAWHHHTIEGATVEWVTTIPSADGTEDELWMICNRSINGADYRTVEVMESDYYPSSSTTRTGMTFQDSHIVIPSGDPYFTGTTITGLNWLIGKTVTITGDGVKVGTTYTVNSSGEITLSANTYDEIVVGPNGNADLGSLPPEGGSNFGTSQGQTKRLTSLDVRFLSTSNVSFGPNTSTLTDKTLYSGSFSWFTGTERLIPKHGYDKESKYYIRQADPYPLNILFVVAKLETNE